MSGEGDDEGVSSVLTIRDLFAIWWSVGRMRMRERMCAKLKERMCTNEVNVHVMRASAHADLIPFLSVYTSQRGICE